MGRYKVVYSTIHEGIVFKQEYVRQGRLKRALIMPNKVKEGPGFPGPSFIS